MVGHMTRSVCYRTHNCAHVQLKGDYGWVPGLKYLHIGGREGGRERERERERERTPISSYKNNNPIMGAVSLELIIFCCNLFS